MSLGSVLVNTATPTLVASDLPVGTSLVNTSSNATMWIGNSSAVATGNGMPVTAGACIQSNVAGPVWAVLDSSAGAGATATLVYSTVATVLTAPAIVAPADNWSFDWPRQGINVPQPFTMNHDNSTYTYGPLSVISSMTVSGWVDGSVNYTCSFSLVVSTLGITLPLGGPTFSTNSVGTTFQSSATTTIQSLPKAPYVITGTLSPFTSSTSGNWSFNCYLSP